METLSLPQSKLTRLAIWLNHHWLLVFSILYGTFVGLPFLAPLFMKLGWQGPGNAIYILYTFLCHQLPQRSYFFFGPERMYDLSVIQVNWENTLNPFVLRQFAGNPVLGWKVAWSDRMVSMYTSILFAAWIWYPLRKRIKGLPLWGLVLLALPLFIDGVTHTISDFAGIGHGFRDTNAWLVTLTNNSFSPTFYAGDNIGSFNSWMRLITGILFGIGAGWYLFPMIDEMANSFLRQQTLKLRQVAELQARVG
jgi:uncharacterized membrane protein